MNTTKQSWSLSYREKQILCLLAKGLNQNQVADKVYLSHHTINFHVRNIQEKLCAANTTAAVAKAISYKLIQPTFVSAIKLNFT